MVPECTDHVCARVHMRISREQESALIPHPSPPLPPESGLGDEKNEERLCSCPWAAQLGLGFSSEDPPQPQELHHLTLFCVHLGMDDSPSPESAWDGSCHRCGRHSTPRSSHSWAQPVGCGREGVARRSGFQEATAHWLVLAVYQPLLRGLPCVSGYLQPSSGNA